MLCFTPHLTRSLSPSALHIYLTILVTDDTPLSTTPFDWLAYALLYSRMVCIFPIVPLILITPSINDIIASSWSVFKTISLYWHPHSFRNALTLLVRKSPHAFVGATQLSVSDCMLVGGMHSGWATQTIPRSRSDRGVDVYVVEENYTGVSFRTEFLKIHIRGFSKTPSENKI